MRSCFRAVVLFLVVVLLSTTATAASTETFQDLDGAEHDPFQPSSIVSVLVFVRTDCPISNRYAPELARLAGKFTSRAVRFWLVYSDRSESAAVIRQQIADYQLPGTPLLDSQQHLARRAEATVTPQAAVFDRTGRLVYSGRIDDRYVDFGKARPSPTTHDLEDAIGATVDGRPVAAAHVRAIGCFLADVK